MIESKNKRALSLEEATQLLKAKRRLDEVTKFDQFALVDLESKTITDIKLFSSLLRKRLKAYEELCLCIDQIQNASNKPEGEEKVIPSTFSDQRLHNPFFSLISARNNYHSKIYERLNFRINSVFELVEEYLDHLHSDPYQESALTLISSNSEQLGSLLSSSQPRVEKVEAVEEELRKIKEILQKDFEEKSRISKNNKKVEDINQAITEKRDKGVMVNPADSESSIIKKPNMRTSQKKVDIEDIKVDMKADVVASELMTKSRADYTFICFSGKD